MAKMSLMPNSKTRKRYSAKMIREGMLTCTPFHIFLNVAFVSQCKQTSRLINAKRLL